MVRNGATGASGLQVVTVQVPAFAEAAPVLLPPFFPEPAGKWLIVREAAREGDGRCPIRSCRRAAVHPGLDAGADPGPGGPAVAGRLQPGPGDLKAEAKVLSLDGKEMGAGDLKLLGSESGSPSRLKASFRPPALQPGEYRLQVTLQDPSGATHSSTTAFSVGGGAKATR